MFWHILLCFVITTVGLTLVLGLLATLAWALEKLSRKIKMPDLSDRAATIIGVSGLSGAVLIFLGLATAVVCELIH